MIYPISVKTWSLSALKLWMIIKTERKVCYLLSNFNINLISYETHAQTATFFDMLSSNQVETDRIFKYALKINDALKFKDARPQIQVQKCTDHKNWIKYAITSLKDCPILIWRFIVSIPRWQTKIMPRGHCALERERKNETCEWHNGETGRSFYMFKDSDNTCYVRIKEWVLQGAYVFLIG